MDAFSLSGLQVAAFLLLFAACNPAQGTAMHARSGQEVPVRIDSLETCDDTSGRARSPGPGVSPKLAWLGQKALDRIAVDCSKAPSRKEELRCHRRWLRNFARLGLRLPPAMTEPDFRLIFATISHYLDGSGVRWQHRATQTNPAFGTDAELQSTPHQDTPSQQRVSSGRVASRDAVPLLSFAILEQISPRLHNTVDAFAEQVRAQIAYQTNPPPPSTEIAHIQSQAGGTLFLNRRSLAAKEEQGMTNAEGRRSERRRSARTSLERAKNNSRPPSPDVPNADVLNMVLHRVHFECSARQGEASSEARKATLACSLYDHFDFKRGTESPLEWSQDFPKKDGVGCYRVTVNIGAMHEMESLGLAKSFPIELHRAPVEVVARTNPHPPIIERLNHLRDLNVPRSSP